MVVSPADGEFARALAHQEAGRLSEAAAGYRALLKDEPSNAAALFNLPVVCGALGSVDEAIELYRHVLDLRPDDPAVLVNLAILSQENGDADNAVKLYGMALKTLGTANEPSRAAMAAHAHNGRGVVRRGRGDLDGAVASFRAAITSDPTLLGAHRNLSVSLTESGRYGMAVAAAEAALERDPGYVPGMLGLAAGLAGQGRFDEAERHLRRARDHAPDDEEALVSHARVLERLRRFTEAVATYEHLLALDADHGLARARLLELRLSLCDWRDYDRLCHEAIARANREIERGDAVSIDIINLLDLPVGNDLAFAAARAKAQAATNRAVPARPGQPRRAAAAERGTSKLRLGYALPYTTFHSMPAILRDIGAHHDRARFSVHGYSLQPNEGTAFSGAFRAGFDSFADIPLRAPARAAARIREDNLDLLIDLTGLIAVSCLEVLAHRPAPVQAHFLGYGLTTGADFVDFLITDRVMIPPELGRYCSERLVYLPHAFMAARPDEVPEPRPARGAAGLPEDALVFCNFNQFSKIEPTVFEVWMRLLNAVPGSVLWLIAWMADGVGNLRLAAERHGVAPDRLVFAPLEPYRQHLARIGLADIVLDTLFHTGGPITLDALKTGVPVLTRRGETPAARLGASLLTAAGAADLIAEDIAAYERRALALANDSAALVGLRARLEGGRRHQPLFDVPGFVRDLETAYELIWQEREDGPSAPPIRVRD